MHKAAKLPCRKIHLLEGGKEGKEKEENIKGEKRSGRGRVKRRENGTGTGGKG